MGRRGQKNAATKKVANKTPDPILEAALAAGGLFRPLPPNKRHDLNQVVEKLLNLTSQQTPLTPQALFEEHLEIRKLLTTVLDLEQCNLNRRLLGSRKAHVPALIEWIEKYEGEIKGVSVENYGDQGLGLKVINDLSEGDIVLTIPRKLMMSVDTARNSEIGRLIEQDPMLKTMDNVSLALHLMLEKTSPASFWEPYINTLPQTYNTVLYFSPEDFQLLKGSPAFEDGLKQFKYVARQYAYFYRKFQNTMLKDYFTFDEYRWSVSTVMTRLNQIPALPSEDPDKESYPVNALIPFWDMANHAQGQLSTDYDDEKHAIKCLANKNFKSGEEFTIFYGKRSNHDLLVHNGFVLEQNVNDNLVIKLGLGKNDALAELKQQLLSKINVLPHGHFFLNGGSGDTLLDPELLAFLRVMCLKNEDEVNKWSDTDEKTQILLQEESGDKELDTKALQYILTRCTLLLRSYPNSLEEDINVLKNENKSTQIQRYCVILRSTEKKILTNVINLCNKMLKKN